ncbi:MAG: hypothetical protein MJY90_00445 [Bacteroidaceae bacterium]|nr:hypothetical protein [Bacteroidaceae bacterium]
MIKRIFTLAMLAGACVAANAQFAKVGFEAGDTKYVTEEALTPGTFGDWVNVQIADSWTEQYSDDDTFAGEYCFWAQNGGEGTENTWDRGFKMGNLTLKEHTPYRISFWAKVDNPAAKLKAQMGLGFENFDCGILSPVNHTDIQAEFTGFNGDWQHFTHVVYFTSLDVQNGVITPESGYERSWVGNGACPWDEEGRTFREVYNYKFPIDKGFVIFNMYNHNSNYFLDDIVVEEGVAFKTVEFNLDMVRLDFGYPTNIKALAEANGGNVSLDPACVNVNVNGETWEVEFLEGKSDGYLYAFIKDAEEIPDDAEVTVSFTPAADCPFVYNTDQRPADFASGDADMPVVGFENEKAYYNENVDALPSSFTAPQFVSSEPENESFELDPNEFKSVSVTYDMPLNLDYASATILSNGMLIGDVTEGMSLSEDLCTINIDLSLVAPLEDGEYVLNLAGIANEMGIEADNDVNLTFSVGEDTSTGTSEPVFCPDFSTVGNGTFPPGWIANDNGSIHQYFIFNEETGEVGNYDWGGNTGGGGPRMFGGFSGGDFTKALYWRSLDANGQATLTYGEQVNDYDNGDGTYDPEMPENIQLWLEPGKYQISFLMAAWKFKGEVEGVYPTFDFELQDVKATQTFASFRNVEARPSVNGGYTLNGNSTRSVTDFTVADPGYYMLKFVAPGYVELLLAEVKLITMPSKAVYWKQQLKAAIDAAQLVVDSVAADAIYDGDTKTALLNEIVAATEGHFTSPSQVEAEIAALKALATALQTRVSNIDKYDESMLTVITALENLEGTKYTQTPEYTQGKALADQYGAVNPSDLSDEELNTVVPQLTSLQGSINNIRTVADILTYRATLAAQTATTLGVVDPSVNALYELVDDDTAAIDAVNVLSRQKLYELIAANGNKLPEDLCTELQYPDALAGNPEGVEYDEEHDCFPTAVKGIELTAFVVNPHLYRVYGNDGVPGWTAAAPKDTSIVTINYAATPSADNRAVDTEINIYGESNYDFNQVVGNLPAGVYTLVMGTRTPWVDKTADYGKEFYYNAQNDSTGVWDKYIYATNGTETSVAPFLGAGSGARLETFAQEVKAVDGQLTIGAYEHYQSGKAEKHEDNTAQPFWTGTTMVDNIRLFLVATDPEFDYATSIENVEVARPVVKTAKVNIAGQVVDGSYKGIVISGGKKYLVK